MVVAKIFAAGIIGGLGMTVSMYLIHFSKLAKADMVVALGSVLTKRKENSFFYGSIIHIISGIFFAFVYSFISQTFQIESLSSFVFLGLLLGFVHGFFVNFLLVVFMANDHPVEEYREASVQVGAAHIVGHIAYGIVTCGVLYFLGVYYKLAGYTLL